MVANSPCVQVDTEHQPSLEGKSFTQHQTKDASKHQTRRKRQTVATAAGLVRIHSCLSPPRVLRRNSSGLPSATATYTALRKAAAGGSLIPESCQSKYANSKQHTSVDGRHSCMAAMPHRSVQHILTKLQQVTNLLQTDLSSPTVATVLCT